jgi:hypothetical protein
MDLGEGMISGVAFGRGRSDFAWFFTVGSHDTWMRGVDGEINQSIRDLIMGGLLTCSLARRKLFQKNNE